MSFTSTDLRDKYSRMATPALILGIVGLVICGLGAAIDSDEFFRSWLMAYLYWFTITIGLLAWTLLHNLVAGKWGFTIRRMLQVGNTQNMVLMAVLFIPILFGMGVLYEWTHEDVVATDHVLHLKEPYLNTTFWVIRLVLFFAIWLVLGFLSKKMLDREEYTTDPYESKMRVIQGVSAGGLILTVFALTFAVTDWGMSLEPHWFSTIYGVIFLVGGALAAIALCNAMVVVSDDYEPFSGYVDDKTRHDLGNLMFALTIFWAYVSFSQFIIIWSGNLAEETPWYLKRMDGPYGIIGLGLIIMHFALPFLILLHRRVKRNPKTLRWMAAYILTMHFFDIFWQIKPAFHEGEFYFHWLDFAAMAGIGGVWLFVFLKGLSKVSAPLIPAFDPRMKGRRPEVANDKSRAAAAGVHG